MSNLTADTVAVFVLAISYDFIYIHLSSLVEGRLPNVYALLYFYCLRLTLPNDKLHISTLPLNLSFQVVYTFSKILISKVVL